jgi:hypothetical protein
MQISNLAMCMSCHQSVMKASPAIQKLAQLQKEGQELSWIRVYQLPDFVFFSHQKHLDAKVGCETCHGMAGDRDVLEPEKDISMVSCINCHKLRKAPVSCGLCHNIGF